MKCSVFADVLGLHRLAWLSGCAELYAGVSLLLSHWNSPVCIHAWWGSSPVFFFLSLFDLSHLWFPPLFWLVADPGKSVMSARFRLPAGRSYNVRATELERDRQHTQVVCNVLLLDNTVQAFKVSVSTPLKFNYPHWKAPSGPFASKLGSFLRQRCTYVSTLELHVHILAPGTRCLFSLQHKSRFNPFQHTSWEVT